MRKISGAAVPSVKTGWVGLAVIAAVLVLAVTAIVLLPPRQKADVDMLITTLQEASELTTAELTYKGFAEFQDEGTLFINRSDFKMIYVATARIGIDIKDVQVSADDGKKVIYVSIPKATVLDVKVDRENIQYFDETFSLFNPDQKEDADRAVSLAEQQTKEELIAMGNLKMADTQAVALIKGLLINAIPKGYTIEVQ